VGSAVLLDSHRPDAFAMGRFELDSCGARGANGAKGANGAGANGSASARDGICAGYGETSPKPLRGEGGANGLIRRQRHPPAIRVSVEHGRPVYIAASKRTMPQGAIMQAAGPWRTSGGWWSEAGGGGRGPGHGAAGWNRDEWDVALASGAVCRIYQDRTTERWFLDGIYD